METGRKYRMTPEKTAGAARKLRKDKSESISVGGDHCHGLPCEEHPDEDEWQDNGVQEVIQQEPEVGVHDGPGEGNHQEDHDLPIFPPEAVQAEGLRADYKGYFTLAPQEHDDVFGARSLYSWFDSWPGHQIGLCVF